MYQHVFWRDFIDLVGFLADKLCDPWFSRHTITAKKNDKIDEFTPKNTGIHLGLK